MRTNIADTAAMPTLTNCPWGWACGLNRSWRSRCRRVRGRGFLTVACGLGLRAARLDLKLLSVFLPPAAEIQESCNLEHDISNIHHWNKDYHDLYKEHDFLDKLRTIFLAGRLFWLSIPFWKENDKSLQKTRNEIGGSLQSSGEHRPSGRTCTNILLGLIILTYVGQLVSKGRVTVWGAKVNSLIKGGQIWRLVTSSFLHADVVHLLVNCYSLNSVGPAVEKLSGPKRFFAVYTASAIAGSTISYYLCKAPAVGASGAIFGLVGSFAVFVLRHKNLMKGGKQSLFQISRIIAINMFPTSSSNVGIVLMLLMVVIKVSQTRERLSSIINTISLSALEFSSGSTIMSSTYSKSLCFSRVISSLAFRGPNFEASLNFSSILKWDKVILIIKLWQQVGSF